MSNTIDQRVVEMRFDNRNFENNVATTMTTLDRFQNKLRFDGATDGLASIDAAAKRVDMSGLGNAIENVRSKFSALEVMGVTALANITNSAVNTGRQLLNSLSIDQITAGWSKYGDKTAYVQTIMNATGKSIDEVNTYLDKLMWFSDETSYSFTDMTGALGQMTSAGGDINKLIPLITGVANATAYAGKGASEFSRVMYNLNQSYSAGNLQYMDWKSLELAGIGSKELKQTFIDTAVAMGKIKEGEVTIANFGQTLQKRWATTDVMEAAFGKFGEMTEKAYQMVQAGEVETASEAYAILAKEYDGVAMTAAKAAQEAKTFDEAIGATKDAVSSGWMKTFEIIFGNYDEAKVLWTDVANSLWDAFASGAEARNEMLEEWKELGGRDLLIESFWNAWDAVASIIIPIKDAFKEIFPPITAKQLALFTVNLRKFTMHLSLGETASENLKRTFKGLFAIVDIIGQAFGAVFKLLGPLFGKVDDLGGGILDVTANMGDWLVELNESIKKTGFFKKAVESIHNAFKKVGEFLKPAIQGIKEFGSVIANAFTDAVSTANDRLSPFVALGEFIKNVFVGAGNIIKKIFPFISTAAAGIGKVIRGLLDTISSAFQNADYNSMFDVANGGIFAAIGVFIAKMFKGKADILGGAGDFMENINGILEGVSDALGAFTESIKMESLKKVATAIAILAGALLVLALIPSEKLTTSLFAITTLFAELMGSMSLFTKILGDKEIKGIGKLTGAMVGLSVALLILSFALKNMSSLSWDELAVGLTAMAASMLLIIAAMKLMPKNIAGQSFGLILLSVAMLILSKALQSMATMSWEEIGKGLVTLAGSLIIIALAMKLMTTALPGAAAMLGMLALAAAMVVLSVALKIMATLSWDEIGRGLVALAGSMIIIAVAMMFMTGAMAGAGATLMVSAAIIILAAALKVIGGMSWEEIAKGLVALAGSLLIIAGAMFLMTTALPGAAALLVVAVALAIFTPILLTLGSMPWSVIVQGLKTLAAVFIVVGAAGLLLAPLVVPILGLAVAITLLGVACVSIGAGAIALGMGLSMIAVSGAAASVSLVTIVSSLISLIPYLSQQIGVGIIAFCETIAGSVSAICAAVSTIVVAIVEALVAAIPPLVEGVFVILDSILKTLVEYTPTIVQAVYDILLALLEGIANNLSKVIQAAVDVVLAFVDGIAKSIPKITQAGYDMMIDFLNGMAKTIRENNQKLIDAVNNLMDAIVDAVIAWFSNFVTKGGELVRKLAGGILGAIGVPVDAIKKLLKDVVGSITSKVSDFIGAAKDLVDGLVKGIKDKVADAVRAAKNLASDVWNAVCDFLGIASPSKKFIEIGKWSVAGLANGLDKYAKNVNPAAEHVGRNVLNTVSGAISSLSDSIGNGVDSEPTIRPVLDLSDIRTGVKKMGGMLDMNSSVGVMANVRSISSSMSLIGQNGGNDDVISAIDRLRKDLSNTNSTTYQINGVTYDDGTNITNTIKDLVRYAKLERRI